MTVKVLPCPLRAPKIKKDLDTIDLLHFRVFTEVLVVLAVVPPKNLEVAGLQANVLKVQLLLLNTSFSDRLPYHFQETVVAPIVRICLFLQRKC